MRLSGKPEVIPVTEVDASKEAPKTFFRSLLGGVRARSFVFGTSVTGGFSDKVDALCHELREGTRFRPLDSASIQANDDKLDAVAWVPFSDCLPSQLIVFAQCKTGTNWGGRTTQLQPGTFIGKWMMSPILVTPIRAFCISEAADRSRWNGASLEAGILFDRCRLVDFCDNLPKSLTAKVQRWTEAATKFVALA